MKTNGRLWILLPSLGLIAFLYWGLSQAESRAIYARWDKLLHASVFFWMLRESVQERSASPAPVESPQAVATWGKHPLDWRWTLQLWRWRVYLVVLGGHERRELSPREQDVARWSVWFLIFVFAVASTAVGAVVMLLIKTALGG